MLGTRAFLVDSLTALGLIAAPFILPHLGFTPTTMNRILVWGMFGIGFDILFGFNGLLSFGQSAFFGTGGMVAAYLLTVVNFPYVMPSLAIGTIVAAAIGYLIGLIALKRTGIYFAMITVAIAEVVYFVELTPLSAYTGGENGLPGVPSPTLRLGFTTINFNTDWWLYVFFAFLFFVGLVLWRCRASSASSWRCALCVRRSARSCAPFATIRCAPPRSATISTPISSRH